MVGVGGEGVGSGGMVGVRGGGVVVAVWLG